MAASSPSSDACRSAGSRLSQNRRGTRILRAAGLVTLAVASALGLFTAQAVATPYSAKLYWGADDAVGTATVDATGTPVSVNLALATGCTGSNSFSTNGTVLVTNIEGQSGFCMQDIDGTNRRTLATDSSVYCPERMLAQVATISYIYYACREYPGLGRISIDGSTSVRQFATAPFSWIRAMTIDVNWIYFADFGGDIRRAPIDGGPMDPTFRVRAEAGQQIAVDSQHLYWTSANSSKIGRSNLDGTGVDKTWLDTGQTGFGWNAEGVAVDGTYIYWLTLEGNVGRANLDGSSPNTSLVTGILAGGWDHQLSIIDSTSPKAPLAAALSNSTLPSITGTVAVGENVAASAGTWSATPAETYYQWQVSSDSGATWSNAGGSDATTNNYGPRRGDVGKQLRVQVRAGAAGGVLTAVTSTAQTIAAIAAVPSTTLYWTGNTAIGSAWVNDTTGVAIPGGRDDDVITGCVGGYTSAANSSAVYGDSGNYLCRGPLDGISPAANSQWVTAACAADGGVGAVYANDDYVYYMCMQGGKLGRVDVDGTNNIQAFGTAGGVDKSYAYRLTADANWIYASGGGKINRYPIDGGPMDATWHVDAGDVRGLAVDSQHLYWSAYPQHVIQRANLDGTGVDSSWLDVGSQFTDGVWGVTVTGSSVYWLTRAYSGTEPATVGRANLDGSGMASPFISDITATSQNHQVFVHGGTAKTPLATGPSNSALPSVSGAVAVAQSLTANPGTWSTTPDEIHYQWQVSSDSGTTWTPAPGAGAQTASYVPARVDIGKTLRVKVRAGSPGGVLTTATSLATQVVPAPAAPANTEAPTFTTHGLLAVATHGAWTNSIPSALTYTYQWRTSPTGDPGTWVDATDADVDKAAYVVQSADAGGKLVVCVTASNGTDATTCSAPVDAPAPPAALGRVYAKSYSVLGDGSNRQDHVNAGGVWGFSSNGTTNVFGGWTDTLTVPVSAAPGTPGTSLASYGFGAQKGVLIDDQYVYATISGAIKRFRIDGTDPQPNFIPAGGGYYMARDGHWLYWTEGHDIHRAPITGGPVDDGWSAHFSQDLNGVAVDGDYIYASLADTGTVARADISGSGVEDPWVQTSFGGFKGLGVDRNGVYVEARSGSCIGLVYVAPDGAGSACLLARDDDSYAISVIPAAADAGALPANTGGADLPTISGTHAVGDTLTASHGTWSNSPGSYTYRWLVKDHFGSTWTAATGASGTTTSYTIPAEYAGKDLKVRVIAHNGSTWSEPAYSARITVPAPPANAGDDGLPAITGALQVGQTLTASPGTWSFLPPGYTEYAYQWQVSDDGDGPWVAATGDGAATSSYVVAAADDAKYLRVKVTATNDDGSTDAFSVATAQIDLPEPDNTEPPVISGTAAVGQVLTTTRGTWTNAAAYAFEWQVSDDGLTWNPATGDGATTDSYTVAAGDLGKYLRVVVTGSNRSFTVDQESAATALVSAPVVPTPDPAPASPGVAQPEATPPPVVVAPGITVGDTFNSANLDPATPAAASDLLKAAQVNLPASATITFVASSLPKGLRLVGGKLVADKPGTYVVRVKVKRKNGKIGTRRVKIVVG